jgi:uncharacterized hydrophobic protein (TIGR00271 family)
MNQDLPTQKPDVKQDLGNLMKSLLKFFVQLIDLQEGLDREGTILWIKSNKRMAGANAWLLGCSIMIASLGLDLDSPAIIIGAMLISPLMSPILGVGMGIGTNDRETLLVSLQHFGVSIAIALISSFVYFWINPLGQLDPTQEIIDRTEPSLLAGLVAIFGGVAGIISASRKDQSNAIPGVAIATALMPPLCVAGYGLAHDEMTIFINAFYLFFLNSFFIAISTFVLIRYMKFPFKSYQNKSESRRTSLIIATVSIVLTIPSVLILKSGYEKKQREQLVQRFINENFGDDHNPQSLNHNFSVSDTSQVLAIKLLGKHIEPERIKDYENRLAAMGIGRTKIFLLQDEVIDLKELDKLDKKIDGYEKIVTQLELSNAEKSDVEKQLEQLTMRLDSATRDTLPILQMNQEVVILRDNIDHLSYGYIFDPLLKAPRKTVVYIHWKNNVSDRERKIDRAKLSTYCRLHLKDHDFEILDAN